MKRWMIVAGTVLVLGGGYVAGAHLSGGAWPTFGLPIGGQQSLLRSLAVSFWEDIQFKDFAHAASYHAEEIQDQVDIPYLIERLFSLKPEMLDVMTYEVVFVDIDSTGLRARVKTRLKIKDLVREEIREQEVILYFQRESTDKPWYMILESSLRQLEADEDKLH